MAHKHTHDHGHSHEHEPVESVENLDAAGKSLSDALRISFVILKVIMAILVIAFLASGFKTVGSDEMALVLRFGKIVPAGDEGVALRPGPHWIFPYPIDEMVKIPVNKQIDLRIYTFWYKRSAAELAGETPTRPEPVSATLNPITEGYVLTRSQDASAGSVPQMNPAESEASDYSIVHTEWQIVYRIGDIEQFFRNVYVTQVRPGQVYADVMQNSIEPMLQSIVEDAVVDAMVHYTIDQALVSTDTIPRNVQLLAQQKLDDIDSGIQLTSVRLTESTWPKQVREAFQAFITASQQSGQAQTDAQAYADTTLNDAAGRVAKELFDALMSDTADANQLETLWSQAEGQAQTLISDARTYRTETVTSAEANAKRLESLLPQYKLRPELVAQQLYLETMDQVLRNAKEKFVLQPSGDAKTQEIRVMLNSDPALRRKQQQDQTQTTNQPTGSR